MASAPITALGRLLGRRPADVRRATTAGAAVQDALVRTEHRSRPHAAQVRIERAAQLAEDMRPTGGKHRRPDV